MIDKINIEPNINDNSSDSNSFGLGDIIVVFRRNWFWAILFVIAGFLVSYSIVRWTQPRYSSSSVLKLEIHKEPGMASLGLPSEEGMDNYNDLSGEIEFLKSNLIYDDVIEKLELNVSYHQEGKFKDEEKFENSPFIISFEKNQSNLIEDNKIYIRFLNNHEFNYGLRDEQEEIPFEKGRIGDTVNLHSFKFVVSTTSYFSNELIDIPFYFLVHSYGNLKNYFSSNLEVNILNVSAKTIKISFNDINANKAAEIVNAIDTVYLYKTIQNKQQVQEQTIAFINGQLDSAENKLNNAEASIENFVRNVKTYDPSSDFVSTLMKIDELRGLAKNADRQLFVIANLNNQIKMDLPMENPLAAYSGIENEQLKNGIILLNEKLNRIEQLKLTYNESTMAFKKQQSELDNIKKGLIDIIKEETSLLNKEKSKVMSEIGALEQRFYTLPSKETELNRLKRFYNLYEKYYLTLQEKGVQYGIAKAGTVPHFVILAQAYPDFTPISPVKKQVYLIYIFGGLLIGLAFLVLKVLMQNTIVNEVDLKSKLKVGFLGSVPKYMKEKLQYSTVIVSDNPKSSITEAFRSIRTNIEFICSLNQKRIIGITSTTSGEGKTFVTCNLAAIIASADKKVIVLDLDMRKPKIHFSFDVANENGMSNILAGKIDFKSCIQHSRFERLDFITAGTIPPNPTELMMRPTFDTLLYDLGQMYDVIVIDTPPVGIVTDANIIMKKLDLTVFVLRYEYTKKGAESVINKIHSSNQFSSIGVVMNSVDSMAGTGYGFGYGYGQGYYEEEEKPKLSFIKKIFTKF